MQPHSSARIWHLLPTQPSEPRLCPASPAAALRPTFQAKPGHVLAAVLLPCSQRMLARPCCAGSPAGCRDAAAGTVSPGEGRRGSAFPEGRANPCALPHMAAAAKCVPDQDTVARLLESLTKLCQTILL